ncbi:hypothetical protein A3742_08005 [Oleiphilus sp. HI0071]|uniref:DUF3461 family protein n=1 Tax=unclassified Oleiphilus TaxID=2631174 RepID=UPI0007C2E68F|nr:MULTISPECIES: DUF3461 family protein [unclassified Oleiphilus]KZY72602.1 hypothetical protein A3737_10890 [Oleiphilus sp. HI0065]KZY82818.1 hypothetical protein A3742_08005 [Oleiphilus sp. HI0071]KZY92159.1 hypothetical protein A3744_19705 [Oleiphilus sp. HI0073]KZZ43826.1 hypothetical protein A3758_04385 [Oleiphilus sp. HI0118]KZZ56664.1 hypothetical protein A3760_08465 [Oleiphilus sp. HI0122]KZZ65592.1 hypothetical protein A3765_00795 [Oleiphilus sp. HI0130]KZZ81241.1 hypothetical prote
MSALQSLGVKSLGNIDHYTVRSERDFDVLKIYHRREKGDLFQKSEKFKFHRSIKPQKDFSSDDYRQVSEVSPMLVKVMDELDTITQKDFVERNAKETILSDLRHLEKVVANKVAEIEQQLEKL